MLDIQNVSVYYTIISWIWLIWNLLNMIDLKPNQSYSTDDGVVHRNVLNIQHNQYKILYFHSLVSENVLCLLLWEWIQKPTFSKFVPVLFTSVLLVG